MFHVSMLPRFHVLDPGVPRKGIEPDIKTWDPAYTVRADVAGLLEILSWNKGVFGVYLSAGLNIYVTG